MKRSQPSPPWGFSLSVKGWWLLCQNQILLKMQWSTWSQKRTSSSILVLVETIPVVHIPVCPMCAGRGAWWRGRLWRLFPRRKFHSLHARKASKGQPFFFCWFKEETQIWVKTLEPEWATTTISLPQTCGYESRMYIYIYMYIYMYI